MKKVHFWLESPPHPLLLFPGAMWRVTFVRTHVGRPALAALVMTPRNFPRTRALQVLTRKGGEGRERGAGRQASPGSAGQAPAEQGSYP